MTFNFLYGGSYAFERVLRVIRRVDPDIVGVQEPYGRIDGTGNGGGRSRPADTRVTCASTTATDDRPFAIVAG